MTRMQKINQLDALRNAYKKLWEGTSDIELKRMYREWALWAHRQYIEVLRHNA